MSRESVLTIGAYREGLSHETADLLKQTEAKEKSGFRLFPMEEALLEVARCAEGLDDYIEELDREGYPEYLQYDHPIGPEEAPKKVKKSA